MVSETESEHPEIDRRFNHRETKLKVRRITRSATIKEREEKALVGTQNNLTIVGSIPIESEKAENTSKVHSNIQKSLRSGALTSTQGGSHAPFPGGQTRNTVSQETHKKKVTKDSQDGSEEEHTKIVTKNPQDDRQGEHTKKVTKKFLDESSINREEHTKNVTKDSQEKTKHHFHGQHTNKKCYSNKNQSEGHLPAGALTSTQSAMHVSKLLSEDSREINKFLPSTETDKENSTRK